MTHKWMYILALLFLPLIRFLVLDINMDAWLLANHHDGIANVLAALRVSPPFLKFIGSWALLVFVGAVLIFWMTEQDDSSLASQFMLLPIIYIPFSIIGMTLATAEFSLSYLYVHPLIILPFGYLYVSFWLILTWLLGKAHIVH
jgi:hypothetical protein